MGINWVFIWVLIGHFVLVIYIGFNWIIETLLRVKYMHHLNTTVLKATCLFTSNTHSEFQMHLYRCWALSDKRTDVLLD